MSLTLYRKSKLGETLNATVEEMKRTNKINTEIGNRIMEIFDRVLMSKIRLCLVKFQRKRRINVISRQQSKTTKTVMIFGFFMLKKYT